MNKLPILELFTTVKFPNGMIGRVDVVEYKNTIYTYLIKIDDKPMVINHQGLEMLDVTIVPLTGICPACGKEFNNNIGGLKQWSFGVNSSPYLMNVHIQCALESIPVKLIREYLDEWLSNNS